MANFTDRLWNNIVRWEGSEFEDDPDDEPTKYGIIQSDIDQWLASLAMPIQIEDKVEYIKNLTSDKARSIMEVLYFRKPKFDKIYDQLIAEKICLMCILLGNRRGIIAMQRAICSSSSKNGIVIEDGIMGPQTLAKLNVISAETFLPAYRSECAAIFRAIVRANEKKAKYLTGWLNRAYS